MSTDEENGKGKSSMKMSGILAVFVLVWGSNAFAASSLDSVKVFSIKIAYVTDERLPQYVRIDAELYSDAKSDLSGKWSTKYDHGWLDLKPNGLATITTYLYGQGLADTTATSLDLEWISLDSLQSGILQLPFQWSRAERRSSPFKNEWVCGGLRESPDSDSPYTTIFIPIPCKVMVLALSAKHTAYDTLFNKENIRGEFEIKWTAQKQANGTYNYSTFINGKPLGTQRLTWPKPKARGQYYYGE